MYAACKLRSKQQQQARTSRRPLNIATGQQRESIGLRLVQQQENNCNTNILLRMQRVALRASGAYYIRQQLCVCVWEPKRTWKWPLQKWRNNDVQQQQKQVDSSHFLLALALRPPILLNADGVREKYYFVLLLRGEAARERDREHYSQPPHCELCANWEEDAAAAADVGKATKKETTTTTTGHLSDLVKANSVVQPQMTDKKEWDDNITPPLSLSLFLGLALSFSLISRERVCLCVQSLHSLVKNGATDTNVPLGWFPNDQTTITSCNVHRSDPLSLSPLLLLHTCFFFSSAALLTSVDVATVP